MKQPTESQVKAIRDVVKNGRDYCRNNRELCEAIIRSGFAQGLNETPQWEGYRAQVMEFLAE